MKEEDSWLAIATQRYNLNYTVVLHLSFKEGNTMDHNLRMSGTPLTCESRLAFCGSTPKCLKNKKWMKDEKLL